MPRIITIRLLRGLVWVAFMLDDYGEASHVSYGTTENLARWRCEHKLGQP